MKFIIYENIIKTIHIIDCYYNLFSIDNPCTKINTGLSNEQIKEKEFVNYLDSLFVNKQYALIIDTCNREQKYYNQKTAAFNLIATYYFIGEKEYSFYLLEQRLKSYTSAVDMADARMAYYTSYKYFLDQPRVKDFIMDKIYTKLNEEIIKDKINARKLLDLFIEDQMIRYNSNAYVNHFSNTRFPYEHLIDKEQSIQIKKLVSTKVYEFYQNSKKIFSAEEIGQQLSRMQLLMFFHDDDLTRREFYLSLIKIAVEKGIFPIEKEIDFQIASDLAGVSPINTFPAPVELVEKYRKLYNKPAYNYFPF